MTAPGKIRVLPDLLVNKIAAGEVVERPASVVKELVENALDAGSTRIAVTIEEGGKQLIRVTDDGAGMAADDLGLAVMPHATSKLNREDDLYAIISMGFRGEALASIGAVSNMRIVSRRHDAVEGHQITVSGDNIQTSGAAGCPAGTSVEVRDLFFNVPARRKFLRTRSTETGHVNEQISRLALGFPKTGFELTNHGRRVHLLPAGQSIHDRIGGIYGTELAAELIPIRRDERGVVIEAFAAPPSRSRSNASWQYVFVNGRFVRDRFIQHAVREAYRGLMEPNRQPIYFVFLTVDPETVDVNVHPTKIEVRWRDSNLVHSQVLAAFRETFLRTDLTPALRTGGAPGGVDFTARRNMADALRAAQPIIGDSAPAVFGGASAGGYGGRGETTGGLLSSAGHAGADGAELWRSAYARSAAASVPPAGLESGGVSSAAQGPLRPSRALQLHNTYLVAETEEGMLIVDQHALHERVLYNQFCERITAGPLEAQRLLLPETLAVTPAQMALLEQNEDLLRRLGIEVTPFGHDSVAVQSFPGLLKDTDVVPFMRDLLDKLADQDEGGKTTDPETVIHAILDMMACKAAVKAGDPLSPEEIDALLAQKHLVEKSSSCPHGRPTTLRLTVRDLEKQFKRV